jgi:hypothetical protein
MKKNMAHEAKELAEPSVASLKEISEVDFIKVRMRRNPYAARIAKEGITVQVGRGRPKKLAERGGTSLASSSFSSARARRPADAGTSTSFLRWRIPEPTWRHIEPATRIVGLNWRTYGHQWRLHARGWRNPSLATRQAA